MFNRLLFTLAFIPLTIIVIVVIFASLIWWIFTGRDLLWIIDAVKQWMDRMIQ